MPDDVLTRVRVDVSRGAAVAPGGKTAFVVVVENKSDAPLPLTFSWPLVAARVVAIKDAAGKDLRDPGAPPCSDPKAAQALLLAQQMNDMPGGVFAMLGPPPRPQIVIAPKSQAHARFEWTANGRTWGPASGKGKDCTAAVVDAPLARGEYRLTIAFPELEQKKLPDKTFSFTVR
jgi:hypothetical protein